MNKDEELVELKERVENLENLFLVHIHSMKEMLGITSGPRKPMDFTEDLDLIRRK